MDSQKTNSRQQSIFGSSFLTWAAIALLILLFLTGQTIRFYASFLFLFYSYTHRMWISVILLGVFQTILMIPIRVMSLRRSSDLEAMEEEFETIQKERRYIVFKKEINMGNKVLLFFSLNFFVQIISYMSLGRLFLTDFYTIKLDPSLIYSFVKYPEYPLQDTFFKLPYVSPAHLINLGVVVLAIVWITILALKIMTVITFKDHPNETVEKLIAESEVHPIIRWPVQLVWSNSIVLFILSFFLVRHYPINWSLKFFIGDVSIPNVQFNTLTAVITFITVIVLSMSHIKKKVETAKKADLTEHQIEEFQKNEVRESFRSAALLGLGAFFITNQIPSAFELSVFTLEVISLLSPYTLDRVIH